MVRHDSSAIDQNAGGHTRIDFAQRLLEQSGGANDEFAAMQRIKAAQLKFRSIAKGQKQAAI